MPLSRHVGDGGGGAGAGHRQDDTIAPARHRRTPCGVPGNAATFATDSSIDVDDRSTGDADVYDLTRLGIAIANGAYGTGFIGTSAIGFIPTACYGYRPDAGGADRWPGVPTGSATFAFPARTTPLGFYIGGAQASSGTDLDIAIDGITCRASVTREDGVAAFSGYTGGTAFEPAKIACPGHDAWGMDNVGFGSGVAGSAARCGCFPASSRPVVRCAVATRQCRSFVSPDFAGVVTTGDTGRVPWPATA